MQALHLKERLAEDLKAAMKARETVRKNTVQSVRAAILQVEKDNKVELDDAGVTDVIAKELKKRRDVLPDYEKSGRADLIAELKEEMNVLMAYLPAQLTREELEAIVRETVESSGATSMKDMGKLMGLILPKVKGRADGKEVNELVKLYLQ